ncbi:uncharacterized protein LOC123273585 [Cotesia glomerata]|uniref:uncharacterized protein LOC123273585 n=1 Tax=Cotesia glomerata TaxID=32391 RepID=UPI001D00C82B|nr:uncharacterized protein LOC123273585 [Cotesia glomerata]
MGPTRLERANVDKHQEYAEYMRTRLTEEASVSNPVKPITTANSGNSQIMSGATRQSSTEVSSAGTSSSDAQGNIDNLQTTIASVNALAAKLNSNDGLQNTTGGLLKEVVDRLCKVHSHMLEVEKSRLKNMQTPEQRGSGPSQEVSNSSNLVPKIQRQYKLTSKSNYEVWIDCLNTELTSWGLLDLIDPNQSVLTGLSELEIKLRKNSVKDIIINHIDEEYHKRILGLTEPLDILKKLRDCRKGEVSSTPTSIRTQLYNLRMNKDERVHKFCERFDQIIIEHEMSDDPNKLTDQEKRSTFYQAIIGAMPEVRRTDSAVISTTGKEMDMEALRKTMYRIQEDNDASKGRGVDKSVAASRVRVQKSKNNGDKCFRCNRTGHWQDKCPLNGTNKWACYVCNCITDHKSEDCPGSYKRRFGDNSNYEPPVKRNKLNPRQQTRGSNSRSRGSNFRGNPRGNIRGASNGNFRGRGRSRGAGRQLTARRAEYEEEAVSHEDGNEVYEEYGEPEADSGATSHIVRKSFILSNFKKSAKGVIKSANKNEIADIVIDAKDISENLLSLRKLADAGFCIYLDDKTFRVYDRENNKTLFKGVYERPNWVVRFEVVKPRCAENNLMSELEKYSCTACLTADNEVSKQSQTGQDNELSRSEGVNSESNDASMTDVGSAIGRESLEYLIVLDDSEKANSEKLKLDEQNSEGQTNQTPYKTVKIDDLKSIEGLEDIINENPSENPISTNILSEAMLWHQRLGHASLNYLKMIQKKDKRLEHVKYANIYCLKSKDESGQAFEKFLSSARNLLGTNAKVCYVRSDRGTEFTGGKFAEIMKKEKIESNSGPPYTPELNGTAERFNKTIQRTIRAYLCDSGLPQSMWEFAANTAIHTYNRTPHKSINYEVPLVKISPNINCHLEKIKRFGCIAFVKLPFVETKFSNVSIKTVLVEHTPTGYILWHPSTRKFLESRHVRFIERLVYKDVYLKNLQKDSSGESKLDKIAEFTVSDETMEVENLEVKTIEPKKRGRPKKSNPDVNNKVSEKQNKKKISDLPTNNIDGPVTRSKAKKIEDISFARHTRISEDKEINEDVLGHILLASIQKDPINFEEAMNSGDGKLWKHAIKRRKVECNGSIKYKARLVSRGFKDKNVYELKETYAPVSRLSLIRAVLSIINKEDLEACQMDVKTAFLNGELEEEVYMEIPKGLEVPENSLHEKFSDEAKKLGLENDLHEPCLFSWRLEGKLAIVVLYVDDMLIASNDSEKLDQIKTHLARAFQMKDLGEPKQFLGMTIQR